MRRLTALLLFASTGLLHAQTIDQERLTRVADDARTLQRIAEVSEKDFPRAIGQRILEQDLEILRGRRIDGSYAHAYHVREESGRIEEDAAVRSKNESEPDVIEIRGEKVYRLIISVPSRRMLVRSNHPVIVESVELEYTPFGGVKQSKNIELRASLAPGEKREIDLPEVARRATARVRARVTEEGGPAAVDLALLRAKLTDDPRSPYAQAVQTLHSLRVAIDGRESKEIGSLAAQLPRHLGTAAPSRRPLGETIDVFPSREPERRGESSGRGIESTPDVEVYMELQSIEDLLTGNEAERRQGLDRLHQLVRQLRPR